MKPAPTVIILAAGQGRRFRQSGGSMHKLDALLHGIPVLERVLRTIAESGLPYYVVRPERDVAGPPSGMGDSIARGVRATRNATGWLILPGDLPLVATDSVLQVARHLASHPVVIPRWNEQHGHPVGFSAACFADLTALSGDTGAASIVRSYRRAGTLMTLHLNDPGIAADIDTLDDLARAGAMLSTRHP